MQNEQRYWCDSTSKNIYNSKDSEIETVYSLSLQMTIPMLIKLQGELHKFFKFIKQK